LLGRPLSPDHAAADPRVAAHRGERRPAHDHERGRGPDDGDAPARPARGVGPGELLRGALDLPMGVAAHLAKGGGPRISMPPFRAAESRMRSKSMGAEASSAGVSGSLAPR